MNQARQEWKSAGQPACDVRAFGAQGNGEAKDTAAIQAAIDRCASDGGGRVLLPAGRYLSGTLRLKDNIDLHLAAGAVLLGSPGREDYNADDEFPESSGTKTENASGAHLVVAYRARNVSITGQGTIDGNASAFCGGLTGTEDMPYRYKARPFDRFSFPWRPGQMVWFCRCKGVSVRDVTLVNTTYWSCLLLGCEDARIRGLLIVNPPTTINGDGLDIDCSRNVTVSDCVIRSGDDSLTLRGNTKRLGDDAPPCENVVVTNCVLSSPCCAIRVGVGDGVVRRCRLSNIVVTDTRTGICVVSRWSESFRHGAQVSDIRFSDFTLDCAKPFHIYNSHKAQAKPPAGIRDLSFDRFEIRATGPSEMRGDPGLPIRDLCFRDIQWRAAWDERAPFKTPAILQASHIVDCRFENMRLKREKEAQAVTQGLSIEDSRDVTFRRIEERIEGDSRFERLVHRNCAGIRAACA